MSEYKYIFHMLYEKCTDNTYLYDTSTEQIKKIAEHIAPANEKERVIDMGGHAIKPQAQIILEQGISQGIAEGAKQVREAVEYLRGGATSEELTQKGYPAEVIDAAKTIQ